MMGNGIKIGRLFGITIKIDWSWLIIFFLITWSLSSSIGEGASWNPLMRWGIASLAALLFFITVLAHEMAHSLTAKAYGIPVRNITLFLFGGVSNIQREPDSPASEFRVAIMGPVTSIIIGVLLLLAAGTSVLFLPNAITNPAQALTELKPLSSLLFWLGSVNIMLGVFNMIPGFPLDGGRVLRSILWKISGDLQRATRWSSWVGQSIAWLMILAGFSMAFGAYVPFFGTGFVNGLWLIFIGWFLNSASSQSYQRMVIQNLLEDVPVSKLMWASPPPVSPNCCISDLVHKHILGTNNKAFPVVEQGRFSGLVTLDDVRKIKREEWDTTAVRQIMTPNNELTTIRPDEDAAEALNKLQQRSVRQLPVIGDDNQLVGLLRERDLVDWLQLQSELKR